MKPPTHIRRPVGGEITPRRPVPRKPASQQLQPKPKPFAHYAPSHNVVWTPKQATNLKRPIGAITKPTLAVPKITPTVPKAAPTIPKAVRTAPQAEPPKKPQSTVPAEPPKQKGKLWQHLQIPLIILGGLLLGILAQSAIIGQTLIIIYGIVAYLRRIESRISFTLAILTIVTTILLIITQNNSQLSQAFAGYTFLFLLIGIICAFRESHEEGKLLSKKRGIFRLRQAKSTRA